MFILQYVDGYCVLVIFCCREYLVCFGWDSGVFFDEFSYYIVYGFNIQRQRCYVQQQNVFYFICQNIVLNCSIYCYCFVWVYVFMWFFIKEFSYFFLNYWYMSLIIDQDNVSNVVYRQISICQSNFQWFQRMLNQIFNQCFQFCMSYFDVYVFRTGCICGDVWQVNVSLLCRRKFDFCFFSCFFQMLYCQWVVMQVDVLVFFEFVNQVVDYVVVKIFIIQVSVIVGRQNFEGFFVFNFIDFNDRDIECIIIKVIYCDSVIIVLFVQVISQSCCGWFVDDMFYFQICDMVSIFGCLMLSIVKVSRYSDNCCSNGFVEEIFCGFFYFFQYFSRYLRSGYFLVFCFNLSIIVVSFNNFVRYDFDIVLNFFVFKMMIDQMFDCKQCVLWVSDCLMFCRLIYQSFIVCVCNYRRSSMFIFCVFNYVRFVVVQYSNI